MSSEEIETSHDPPTGEQAHVSEHEAHRPPEVDIQLLAEKVYQLMRQELRLEKLRGAGTR